MFLANFIPEEKISEISRTADIVDIVSEVVLLKKTGKNYVGLCPFHSEKTPSFTVSADKQIFYCFGCGEGGDVFKFIKKQNGYSFLESVKMLAGRYNIVLPEKNLSPEQKRRIGEKEQIFRANKMALAFYHNQLISGENRQFAQTYLKKRGITKENIDRFQLGFAPEGWDHLKNYLISRNISHGTMVKAGLTVSRKSQTGYYDRFRNRIIFPIFNVGGRVVGFGGRVMDDALPKYLNTPETPVFNKRQLLYGLNAARNKCRETGVAYMVEGYCDVLALYQYGIENTVATLGTALTSEHIRLVRGSAKQVVLVYDSDVAGIKAARRSCDIFLKENMDARIMVLPTEHDPDSFIREHGRDPFLNLASRAKEITHYLIDMAMKNYGHSVNGKIRVMDDLKNILAAIDDPMARSLYTKELAERLGIDEKAVQERIRQSTIKTGSTKSFPYGQRDRPGGSRVAAPGSGMQVGKQGTRQERQIISMMLQFPQIIPEIKKRNILALFTDNTLKQIGNLVLSQQNTPDSVKPIIDIMRLTDDETLQRMAAFLMVDDIPWKWRGCLNELSQFESRRQREDNTLLQKIRDAEKNNDQDLLKKLMQDMKNQAWENQRSA